MCNDFFLGGNIGVMMSVFSAGAATGPPMQWTDPMSYPAISGLSVFDDVTFAEFEDKCGRSSIAVLTHTVYGDIIHPMTMKNIHLVNVLDKNKVDFDRALASKVNTPFCLHCYSNNRCFWIITYLARINEYSYAGVATSLISLIYRFC